MRWPLAFVGGLGETAVHDGPFLQRRRWKEPRQHKEEPAVSEYAHAPDPEARFDAARDRLEQMIAAAREHSASGDWSADAAERAVVAGGRTLELHVLQGFHDARATAELHARTAGHFAAPVDAGGVQHGRIEPDHARRLSTTVGCVTVRRLAFRAPQRENLYPADAELNLPAGLHSHEVAKMAAIESARGSFADAADALARRCGASVAAPQAVRAMAIAAARDFDGFYDHTAPMMSSDGTLLVLSVDGKGIVMRPADLREATRKKAERDCAAGRLGDDGHAGRKSMATIGAVYDAEPAPRRPHDIITLAKAGKRKHKKKAKKKDRKKRPGPKAVRKWLTASVAANAADVIKAVFDQAEARDPEHRRTWVVLADGAVAQIDAIRAEAAKRNAPIRLVIDIIHVLQYLHVAARVLHSNGNADTAVAEWALTVLNGRSADVADHLADAADARHDSEDRKKIGETVTYLRNKHDYLCYDTALAAGWPIATGIVEGAARHLIADRLDITGARWSLAGAEAVLKLRALISNGDLETYWRYHVKQEHQRNHIARYQRQYQLTA